MKKRFLSVVLAVVMIYSVSLFPLSAAAEESTATATAEIPAAETPIQDPIVVSPADIGDQTTYMLCFTDDGRFLTSAGTDTPYTNQYISGSSSQQWIFEDAGLYTYIIRSAANPTYALAVNPSTGSIYTKAYDISDSTLCWTLNQQSNGYYLQAYNNLYLYSSGTYPFTLSAGSSGTLFELIIPTSFQPVTSFTVQDIDPLFVGKTKTISTPVCTPSNAQYTDSEWFTYTSGNTSICTVDENGTVTGVSQGTTNVTVTHKITRVTTTCSVRVVGAVTYYDHIYYDVSASNLYTPSDLVYMYTTAADKIYDEFLVSFVVSVSEASLLSSLTGYACANTELDEPCSTACGAITDCRSTHCKNAFNLTATAYSTTTYSMRMVGHALCDVSGNTHENILGMAFQNSETHTGTTTLVSVKEFDLDGTLRSVDEIRKTIQHELSHLLGAPDDSCTTNQDCVMRYGTTVYDVWCDNCRAAIEACR